MRPPQSSENKDLAVLEGSQSGSISAKEAHREISRWLEGRPLPPDVHFAAERVKAALWMRAKNQRSDSLTRHLAEVTDELEAALTQSFHVD